MTIADLQSWLQQHVDDIATFMDYEPTITSDEELATTLSYWFDGEEWSASGHRFASLGIDGTGGQFAAWIRPGADGPPPVVFFGSEGGRGVLARSPGDWARILAHAPGVGEYSDDLGPSELDPELNFVLEDDEADTTEARAALARYRAAAGEALGTLPPFPELLDGIEPLRDEFLAWVERYAPKE